MRKFGLLFFALVMLAPMFDGGLGSNAKADAWLSMLGVNELANRSSSLIVKIKKKKKHNEGNQGERSCPAGYVVLDKPNKYGAFCEPKEGLPAPEAEKCKFGMIGTPPNHCHCPEGTEFEGYKGCVAVEKKIQSFCNDYPVQDPGLNANENDFIHRCDTVHKGASECHARSNGLYFECCCSW